MTLKISEVFSVKDKVVLVTGALGFLGQEIVSAFLENDAKVALSDLDTEKNTSLVSSYISDQKKSLWIPIDVTNPKSIDDAVMDISSELGKIDVLVNNAAIDSAYSDETSLDFENYPLEEWNKMITVNLTGAFSCCQRIVNHMLEKEGGVIINIASVYGIVAPNPAMYKINPLNHFVKSPAYGASKAALHNLTKYLTAHYGGKGIRANTLAFGGVKGKNTNAAFEANYSSRTPLNRMMKKEELAGPVLFLASDASSYVSGAQIVVDGGFTIW